MRRIRKEATKVWHNPEIAPIRAGAGASEALFAPQNHANGSTGAVLPSRRSRPVRAAEPRARAAIANGRIVQAPPPPTDAATLERQRLLQRLLLAEGRPSVSRAANEYLKAGYELPEDQDVYLQLLEHSDEEKVCDAIVKLTDLLAQEPPKRRSVLESRLRRIEQFAEEPRTQRQAEQLRRSVGGHAAD